MITLNEIAYNIRNLAYGGKNSTENNINIEQIKHWVHYHRAKLIADNVDKGITHNNSIYQSIPLIIYNSASLEIRAYIRAQIAYLRNTALGAPAVPAGYMTNTGNSGGNPLPEFLAISDNVSSNGSGIVSASWGGNQHWHDQYGRETVSTLQNKGDYRNFGYHKFEVPAPIQLKDNKGVREVYLQRSPKWENSTGVGQTSAFYKGIKLYNKEYGNFDEYNKFTNNSKPYYSQETSKHAQLDDNGFSGIELYPGVQASNKHIISLNQLQVSPNYLEGLDVPTKKMYWKYRGSADMILENPTHIAEIFDSGVDKYSIGGMLYDTLNPGRHHWEDDKNAYPIPAEHVSDLIQRVIQVELQTELKTQGDEIADGLDDNLRMKRSGAQVQR